MVNKDEYIHIILYHSGDNVAHFVLSAIVNFTVVLLCLIEIIPGEIPDVSFTENAVLIISNVEKWLCFY